MDIIFLLCGIAFLAGLVQGLTGFGSLLVALPLMGLLIDIKIVVPLILMLGFPLNLTILSQLMKYVDHKKWIPMILTALPGIFVGTWILTIADSRYLEILVGCVVVLTSSFLMLNNRQKKQLNRAWAYTAGFIAGFLGGSIGAVGPPVIIYTSFQPWDKQQIKATMVFFFIVSGTGIFITYLFSGLITQQVIISFGYCVLPLLAGVTTGIYIFNRINDTAYRTIINMLLFALGVILLFK